MTTEIKEIIIKVNEEFNLLCGIITDNIDRDTSEFDRESFLIDLESRFSQEAE